MPQFRNINIRAVEVEEQSLQGIMRVDTQLDNMHFFGGICTPFEVSKNGDEQIKYGSDFFYGDDALLSRTLRRTRQDGFLEKRTPAREAEQGKIYRIPLYEFSFNQNLKVLLQRVLTQNRSELPTFLQRLRRVEMVKLTPNKINAIRLGFRSFPPALEQIAFERKAYYRYTRY